MRNKGGGFNQSYENMRLACVGDLVFSYAGAQLGAVGRVTVAALACPKPEEFGRVGHYWSNDGWLVEVDFFPLWRPLSPRQHIQAIGPLLPPRYSPIQSNGNGNQGMYLAAISDGLGMLLMTLTGADQIAALSASQWKITEAELGGELIEDIEVIRSD
jgi:hypothetical protein